MKGLSSIIIPTYNHGRYILDAVESALAQTAPVEVIVVDDGSTDNTAALLSAHVGRIRYIQLEHGGVCAARNAGIEAARGEFLMFLDADDVIAPTKIEAQVRAFTAEVGWVLCDVRIEDDARGKIEDASQKYDYSLSPRGWLQSRLKLSNIIPIMSPLVRRSVLGDTIRFHDEHVIEDWQFWIEVAGAAPAEYVDEVLATYRHRRTGRSRLTPAARAAISQKPAARMPAVLFSPHADDETLFAAFTILRFRPHVVICFPSAGDYGTTAERLAESRDAAEVLGAPGVDQWNGQNMVGQMRAFDRAYSPARVFAPDELCSHADHLAVARAAREVFGDRLTTYHTYAGEEKIRSGAEVPFEPAWVQHKLRALARYETQIQHPRANRFFLEDLREYYGKESK